MKCDHRTGTYSQQACSLHCLFFPNFRLCDEIIDSSSCRGEASWIPGFLQPVRRVADGGSRLGSPEAGPRPDTFCMQGLRSPANWASNQEPHALIAFTVARGNVSEVQLASSISGASSFVEGSPCSSPEGAVLRQARDLDVWRDAFDRIWFSHGGGETGGGCRRSGRPRRKPDGQRRWSWRASRSICRSGVSREEGIMIARSSQFTW
jgi:hypothetical protein